MDPDSDPFGNGLEDDDEKSCFEDMEVSISDDKMEVANSSIFTQTQNSKSGKIFAEFLELLQEMEKCPDENINEVLTDKLTSAPERIYLVLTESGCERDLSYSLQVICNGLLHFQNREQIYLNRLDVFLPFLKQLFENCIKTLESIDSWTSRNSKTVAQFDEDSSDEVIEVLMEIILSTSTTSSNGIRSSSKIFITLLREVESLSISCDVVKRLTSEILKLLNTEKLKIANFLIKLLGSFLKEVLQKNIDLNEAMSDMVNLLLELQRKKDEELPARSSLLRLLLCTRDFVSDILYQIKEDCTGDTILLMCEVVKTLATVPPSNRKSQSTEIIKLVLHSLETNKDVKIELIDELILPKLCQLIHSFDQDEFNNLQDVLFTSSINSKQFFVLELLADMYSFICKISPISVVRENMNCFCKESLPLKIKVFILPAIARSVETKMCSIQTNSSFICKFELINSKCRTESLEKEDYQFIENFWTSIATGELEKEEWETIIAICLRMRYTAQKMDNKLTAVILGTFRKLLSKCTHSQIAAVTALQILRYIEGKSDQLVFQILRLYARGNSDDYVLSLLKYFLERKDFVVKLEDYENDSTVELLASIEESVDKIMYIGPVNSEDKERIRTIICSLQKLL